MLDVVKVVCSVVEHSVTMKGPSQAGASLCGSADPLEEPSLLLGKLDPPRFWHGIDAGLADRWSTGSKPSLFPLPGDQLHLAEPVCFIF